MHDCSKDMIAFHNEEVTLLQPQRTEMRDRRNSNRDRLMTRLKDDEKPTPQEFIKQGSYAMLTMVQDSELDYDIDDGIYYTQASLKDDNDNDMSPKDARQLVCNALKDTRFSKQPQVKPNCVRIFYQVGYHVDMPVYRIAEEYELAAGDAWVVSRAADVEDWFNRVNTNKSPDETNGRQFRRIVRLLKKFARSRKSWKEIIASGFTITKLAEERYISDKYREDLALRDTMKSIYDRLLLSLEVYHPVTPGAKLTNGSNDSSMAFLKDKLAEALEELKVLDNPNCKHKDALVAWDKVFNTEFFSDRYKDEDDVEEKSENDSIFASLVATSSNPKAVDKHGGGRFA